MSAAPWFEKHHARMFLDVHVPDWDKRFLSRFDPKAYVDILDVAGSKVFTVFANSHTGLNHWPSRVGRMHKALKGRDLVRELSEECRRRAYTVILYYCTIYVDWYWDRHPDARVVDANGQALRTRMRTPAQPRRYSTCCPNHGGYREFVRRQLTELAGNYEPDGFWIDMVFWPTVCYCASCQRRFRDEAGEDIPRIVDWTNPVWVSFHRKRQQWLVEFERMLRETVKVVRPDATVVFQSKAYSRDWLYAPSVELSDHTDWLSADLYEGTREMSFMGKLFHSQSNRKPFEQVNTWFFPEISEHVVARTEEHLKCQSFNAMINGGAQVLIDILDPEGTTNPRNYQVARRVIADIRKYSRFAGGEFCRDVAVYYSFDSVVDLHENGMPVVDKGYNLEGPLTKRQSRSAHANSSLSMGTILLNHHIPFGVITRKNLDTLDRYQIVVLSNLVMMSDEEISALREYVRRGGSLYVSKDCGVLDLAGRSRRDLGLGDVLGVHQSSRGPETRYDTTFVAPVKDGRLFAPYTRDYPITYTDRQNLVAADVKAEILATITLPYCDPHGSRYAIIHADPPGVPTSDPAVVMNRFGRGRTLYCAGAFETWGHSSQQELVAKLLGLLARRPYCVESNGPACVELALLAQPQRARYALMALNYQQQLPNVTVRDMAVRVNVDQRIRRVRQAITNRPVRFARSGRGIEIRLEKLEVFDTLLLEYS